MKYLYLDALTPTRRDSSRLSSPHNAFKRLARRSRAPLLPRPFKLQQHLVMLRGGLRLHLPAAGELQQCLFEAETSSAQLAYERHGQLGGVGPVFGGLFELDKLAIKLLKSSEGC